jgi:hypothetical protein
MQPAPMRLLGCLLGLLARVGALTLTYPLSQQDCAAATFWDSAAQFGSLTPSGPFACPATHSADNQVFNSSSAGFMGEISSSWTTTDLLAGGRSFGQDVFSIAVWFTQTCSASTGNPPLLRFGRSGALVLRANSVDMQIGSPARAVASTTSFSAPSLNQPYLLVLAANVTTFALYRRNLATNQTSALSFVFQVEDYLNASVVLVPRMSTWTNASLILGSSDDLCTVLAAAVIQDAVPAPSSFLDAKPLTNSCPSVAPFALNATENQAVTINLAPHAMDIDGNPIKLVVTGLPRGGFLADANATLSVGSVLQSTNVTYVFSPDLEVHPLLDQFTFRAADFQCLSVFDAVVTLHVRPCNHAPHAISQQVQVSASVAHLAFAAMDLDGASDLQSVSVLTPNLLFGVLTWCASPTQAVPGGVWVTLPANGSGLCYQAEYTSRLLNRTAGLEVVGQDVFVFSAVDKAGAASAVAGQLTVQLANPATSAFDLTLNEDSAGQTLAAVQDNASSALVVALPAHGHLALQLAPEQAVAANVWLPEAQLMYVPDPDAFGADAFQVRIRNPAGFVSPVLTVQVFVNNTYDPSVLELPEDVAVKFAQLVPLNISLINLDGDSYSCRLALQMKNPGVLVSLASVPANVQVTRGSSCIEVGCEEPIELRGLPSAVNGALRSTHVMAVATPDNVLLIQVFDELPDLGEQPGDLQAVNVRVQGGVWGTGEPVARGSAALGAAILGAVVALGLVLGRGAWTLLPRTFRERVLRLPGEVSARARAWRSARGGASPGRRSVATKVFLRPPPHVGQQQSKPLPFQPESAVSDKNIGTPPGMTDIDLA